MPGPHVRLVPFEERHISDEYIGWLNDQDLMRYSRQRFVRHDRESSQRYLMGFKGTSDHFWSIERSGDGVAIGTMTAYVDDHDRVADIGILIGHPDARGTGLGREAWGSALEHLFRVHDLRKVTAGTSAANTAMVKIIERWRFRLEGNRREQELIAGRPCDVLLFGLLRKEWEGDLRVADRG